MFLNYDIPQIINPFSIPTGLRYSNAAADWAFYDVSALNTAEFNYLVHQKTLEGTILVALPSDEKEMGILKYKDFTELKEGVGKPLKRFSIAGVGSSDVGAAALARTLANFYNEPVGAIVAGYGMADMLQEAMGGWFVLGGINRELADSADSKDAAKGKDSSVVGKIVELSPDTETLLSLLSDSKREMLSLVGHSKGALSIALALQALEEGGDTELLEKAKKIDLVTFGSVVNLPSGFDRVRQFLGSIDWFGGLNSQSLPDRITVPNASHHLNTSIPCHVDVAKVLQQSQQ